MNYPGAVLALSRPVNDHLSAAVGGGRFAVAGAYDSVGYQNADLVENVLFFGLQYRSNATSMYHLQYRLYDNYGSPTTFGGPSPDFHGPQIIFEQVFKT